MPTWQKKKYLKLAKGFYGRAKNCMRVMAPKVEKSLTYAYRDRRTRPRIFRRDWIMSINSGVREHGINYSNFIFGLNRSNILLNRKILADLAINEPYSFKAVVDEIKLKPFVLKKPEEETSYLDALSQGYLIEGAVKPKILKPFKIAYFGERPKLEPEPAKKP